LRILVAIGVVAILLTFMIHPGNAQFVCSMINQTSTWPAPPGSNKVLAGSNSLQAPWYPIPVNAGCKFVRLQYFEVNVRIDNSGPGPFAFDIYAQFVTPVPQAGYSLLPFVYASQSAILQRVGVDSVPQGWTGQATFSVSFSTSHFALGAGLALVDASGINYTDNVLTTTVSDSFGATFGIKGATPNGYITVGPTNSIRVQATSEVEAPSTSTSTSTSITNSTALSTSSTNSSSSSSSIPEFETASIIFTLSALITVLALSQVKRAKKTHE
jgi:hypothetical protein